MSDESAESGEGEQFSGDVLGRMVREVRPEWTLRAATPAEEGTDVVYFLTVDTGEGTRECVLKACEFLDPEAFRPEPYLLDLLDRRTSIPVPGIVGAVDDHDDLPAPFFLMERLDGEVREGDARDLAPEAMERIARDAGRNLGRLHRLGEFERFGPLRLAGYADESATGRNEARGETPRRFAAGDRTLTLGESTRDSWRERFEEVIDSCLDNVEARFEDLVPDLRAFVADRLDALDRSFPAVIGHDDYRLGNLLVDPETGETHAVLDWGNVATMEAQCELVDVEQYLCEWAPHDDPLRERVRASLLAGYRETNEIDRDDDYERRRELYLATSRLSPMVCFSLWNEGAGEDAREATAKKHREAVLELVG
ncbi:MULTISPECIES: phosphotransferase family protein [Halorussus]|uniref:phosphotransferase family protein n=1 Tax=Halorussus TaxID=1070314 RepID=UPI0020A09E70|nr:phosphotransferase [Halorussus vallis]USZ75165.1 phosphotransferase [Halorussus vallis]